MERKPLIASGFCEQLDEEPPSAQGQRPSVEILLISLSILVTAVFAMAEIALVSANRQRLVQLAAKGSRGAREAIELLSQPTRFLSTIETGVTFAAVIGSIYAGAPLADRMTPLLAVSSNEWISGHAQAIAEGMVSLSIGSATIVLGSLVPKRIALQYPEGIAVFLAIPLRWVALAASPLIRGMSWVADLFLHLFGINREGRGGVSEDEVRLLIDQGIASGVFHEGERRMVAGALALDTTTAEQLMTPSNRVVWLNLDDTDEVNWRKVVASGHTWFPVFRGSPDKALGVVSVKRLWSNLALTGTAVVRDLVTMAPSVQPSLPATQLLERFRTDKIHLALVEDEFGRVRGVVSLNDVLERIVGELPGELASVRTQRVRRRDDGSWIIDAMIPVTQFREALGLAESLPGEGTGRFSTLAGFLQRALGRLPEEGDQVLTQGYVLEVVDMDGHRVDKVLATRKG